MAILNVHMKDTFHQHLLSHVGLQSHASLVNWYEGATSSEKADIAAPYSIFSVCPLHVFEFAILTVRPHRLQGRCNTRELLPAFWFNSLVSLVVVLSHLAISTAPEMVSAFSISNLF